ncbi:MAG: hypothetical protein IPI67_20920 [Myxococcales bacterium]|nr:hypothetical protein [Myxococcales bacterium]
MARLAFVRDCLCCVTLLGCSDSKHDMPGTTGAWESRADAPVLLGGHAAAVVAEQVYVAGRQPTDKLDRGVRIYDPAADAWSSGADLPEPRFNLAVAVLHGDTYALGGSYGYDSHAQTTAWMLPAGAAGWAPIADLGDQRTSAAAVALGGRVILVGGSSENQILSKTLEFDPTTKAWSELAVLPTPRASLAAVVYGERLYALGGYVQSASTNHPSAALERYDRATDTWVTLPPMPTPRSHLGAAVLGGRIYAIGGVGEYNTQPLRTVEVFDPATETWQDGESLPVARAGAATVVWHERAYVIGGAESLNEPMTGSVLAFSP